MERGICTNREMDDWSISLKQVLEKVLHFVKKFEADLKPR